MAELKIGGFKNASPTEETDLVFTKINDLEEPITPEPDITPEEPVIPEPTNIPDVEGSELSEPTTPVETNDQVVIPPVEIPTEPVRPVEIDDTIALKYLSEKLGKEFQSFDELKPQQTTNPLENDPYLKKLYEWREKTGRPIEDWIKYQKDYNTVNDIDVAREFLQYEYPTLTDREIDLEMKKFIPSDVDLDDESDYKLLELKKYATKGRQTLSKYVTDLGEPLSSTRYSQEIQQDLDLTKQIKLQSVQDQEAMKLYAEGIQKASLGLDVYKLNLADNFDLDFKVPDISKKDIPTFIDTMPHWKNTDGSWNHSAVVQDAVKIKHFDEIVKLAYQQGLNAGKENIITEVNNVTINQPTPAASVNGDGKKGVVIEGLDEYLGTGGMKMRLKK